MYFRNLLRANIRIFLLTQATPVAAGGPGWQTFIFFNYGKCFIAPPLPAKQGQRDIGTVPGKMDGKNRKAENSLTVQKDFRNERRAHSRW